MLSWVFKRAMAHRKMTNDDIVRRLLFEKQKLEKENNALEARIKELEEKVTDMSKYSDSLNPGIH
jgi:cell division protein FtsB